MERPAYRLTKYRGKYAVIWYEGKRRCRRSLGTDDRALGEVRLHEFARIRSLQGRGAPVTVASIFQAYIGDRRSEGKPVERMHDAWKRLAPAFGTLLPSHITKDVCRAYIRERGERASNGTIHLELTYLRAALAHAERENWITKAPFIVLPGRPKPKDHYLTRPEVRRLMGAAIMPHVQLFITLAITTGGRASAILGLRWSQIDFERGQIDLRDHGHRETNKGRAIVPMNDTARAALMEAKAGAVTPYVIEYGGQRVLSIKKGMTAAAMRAGLKCSPHVLRHSAAVWMAEDGVSIEEIAQLLGHSNTATTYRVYARFSPQYLKKAARSLEL